jgi:lipopolysaccharide/colanic/teichoic acid biosynthesis glycosyltransferase
MGVFTNTSGTQRKAFAIFSSSPAKKGSNTVTCRRSEQNSPQTMPHFSFKPSDLTQRILPEDLFLGLLCFERKRAERSGKTFFLLLIDARGAVETDRHANVLKGMIKAAAVARRETDPAGWYKHEEILGIIFTDFRTLSDFSVVNILLETMRRRLAGELSAEDLGLVQVSAHTFTNELGRNNSNKPANPLFYPDLLHGQQSRKISLLLKRALDIIGSLATLILFSPLFVLAYVMVKLSSPGPALFRQQRVGQFGVPFEFLKFRSMHAANNSAIHEQYVRKFIAGNVDPVIGPTNGRAMYKITDDPRVTWVGYIIRRTSIDELPQLWNVLKGEMSLVGPRPSLPYEIEGYRLWHGRRLLEAKPGITGLWQVRGRSRTTFDEMVRLDLQYSRTWSLLLDITILLQTPRAVLFGDGAY